MEILKFLEPYKWGREAEGLKELYDKFLIKSRIMNGKVLLKYDIRSDKTLEIVRECRGIILSIDGFEVISLPISKFGNHGEAYAPTDMDFTKCRVVEKLDGTCCGLYFSNIDSKWHVQTLSQPEAQETAKGFSKEGAMSYKWSELFWDTFSKYTFHLGIDILSSLDKDWTYVFELCTPWNKVVIRHNEPKLYFLAQRNKKTFLEDWPEKSVLFDIFDKPKTYLYNSVAEIVNDAKEKMTSGEEGVVVVDENFRRIKIKSAEYVKVHYENTVLTLHGLISVVFQNEQDEWLSSFPEYKPIVDIIMDELKVIGKKIDDYCNLCLSKLKDKSDRKELALIVKQTQGFSLGRHYIYKIWSGDFKNGIGALVHFDKKEEITKKVRQFIDNSAIIVRAEPNKYTASLR